MVEKRVILNNAEGLHARAAALFVRVANKFSSEITLEAHEERVNGKSIIGIMSLGAFSGEEVTVSAEGPDDSSAVDQLCKLIENDFMNL